MNPTFEKLLYILACTVSVVLAITAIADVALQGRADAQQALKTKQAVCALRSYYQSEVDQSEAFLKLSQPERVKKYGSIGDIPDSVIQSGLVKERQFVRVLSPGC